MGVVVHVNVLVIVPLQGMDRDPFNDK